MPELDEVERVEEGEEDDWVPSWEIAMEVARPIFRVRRRNWKGRRRRREGELGE